ncbi:MAG: hypothetical protein J0L53_12925 [Spirochaetes bacterium]|nr:hypothetical protein [Spirochaetota bacterium]
MIRVLAAFSVAGVCVLAAQNAPKEFGTQTRPQPKEKPAAAPATKPVDPDQIDENKLFSEGETVTPIEKIKDDKVDEVTEKESVGFSGSINSRNSYAMSRDWLLGNTSSTAQNTLNNQLQNNLNLEARARRGTRAVVNLVNNVYAQGKSEQHTIQDANTGAVTKYNETVYADYRFTEAFVDANIARAVYFRAGKQVLVWGRGFFWNPSDVINTELRSATDAFQFREGTYGLRAHVPIGTAFNFYSFTGVGKSTRAEDIIQAFKAEVAVSRAEIAAGVIMGQKKVPTYLVEASTRFWTLDWRAEATYAYGDNAQRIDVNTFNILNPVTYQLRDQHVFKGVLSVGRSFEVFDVADRLTINLEYFYNGAGYNDNIFAQNNLVRAYFVTNGLYRANYYGMHYLGFFATYTKFILNEMTLGLNGFGNLSDKTFVFSELLTYTPLFNLTLTWQNNIFTGAANGEYTVSGLGWYSEFSARVSF